MKVNVELRNKLIYQLAAEGHSVGMISSIVNLEQHEISTILAVPLIQTHSAKSSTVVSTVQNILNNASTSEEWLKGIRTLADMKWGTDGEERDVICDAIETLVGRLRVDVNARGGN